MPPSRHGSRGTSDERFAASRSQPVALQTKKVAMLLLNDTLTNNSAVTTAAHHRSRTHHRACALFRTQGHTDNRAQNYDVMRLENGHTDASSCCSRCDSDHSCAGFTVFKNACYLKRGEPALDTTEDVGAGRTSYVKKDLPWPQANAHHKHGNGDETASRAHRKRQPLGTSRRLALCLTGLINHGEPNGAMGPNLRAPLSSPQQLARLGAWLERIRSLNVTVDIFLALELNEHPKKHPITSNLASMLASERAPVISSQARPVSPAKLVPIITSLQPVRMSLVGDEAPFCTRRPSFCKCNQAFPRWWEQMSKIRTCSNLVGAYERQTAVHYDGHLQMRSDNDVQADQSVSPSIIASALDYVSTYPTHAFVKPYSSDSNPVRANFGQADFYWLAARPAAAALTSLVDASCAWQRCIAGLSPTPLANERLFVRWALRNGISLSTTKSPTDKLVDANQRDAKQCNHVEAYGPD